MKTNWEQIGSADNEIKKMRDPLDGTYSHPILIDTNRTFICI